MEPLAAAASVPAGASRSLYRGHAHAGLGEGPGNPILRGEQFLLGSDRELAGDIELLQRVRLWITLDFDPADLHRLGDRLEGWSCAAIGRWEMVACLRPAGIFDRRAAYFSHARLWPRSELSAGHDPGTHLGRSEAFDPPHREGEPFAPVPEGPSAMVRPEQVRSEQQAAARLLAGLYDAISTKRPLIVAASLEELAAGSPLTALLSFARAALPADLKARCRVRLYTRNPELFLRSGSAGEVQLLAIPSRLAEDALAARRDALLVDDRGVHQHGRPPAARSDSYANAVVERAVSIPEGLLPFSARIASREVSADSPQAAEAAIQVTYNLAYTFDRPGERCSRDFVRYLWRKAEAAPGLPWGRLISAGEWDCFPSEAIVDLLLAPARDLGPGALDLQRRLEDVAAGRELSVAARVDEWWQADDAAKQERLLDLMATQPPLLPLDRGLRWVAQVPPGRLAELATKPGALAVLTQLTAERGLEPDWLASLVERAKTSADLAPLARALLDRCASWPRWGKAPKLLLDRLLDIDDLDAGLADSLLAAGAAIDPLESFDLAARLAELTTRLGVPADPLRERLRKAVPSLGRAAERSFLISVALDPRWRAFDPGWLFRGGDLAAPWLSEHAVTLLESDRLLASDQAPTAALLRLAERLPRDDDATLGHLFDALDARWHNDPAATTSDLVRRGWWWSWRLRAQLDAGQARAAAKAWLGSPGWAAGAPEAHLETWRQVLADLGRETLAGDEATQLRRDDRPTWPWIPGFERVQLQGICRCAADLGALAELAEAADGAERRWGRISVWELARQSSTVAPEVGVETLRALVDDSAAATASLAEAITLQALAGHRQQRARKILAQAALRSLEKGEAGGLEAVETATRHALWQHQPFLGGLARWLANRPANRRSLEAVGTALLDEIERRLPEDVAPNGSAAAEGMRRELHRQGYKRIARLLGPPAPKRAGLWGEVAAAFEAGDGAAACWGQLVGEIQKWKKGTAHPLALVAARLSEHGRELHRRVSAATAWQAFEGAVERGRGSSLLALGPATAPLPALELLAAASPAGARGTLAAAMVLSPATAFRFSDLPWWSALLRGVRAGSPAADDPTAALAVLDRATRCHPTARAAFEKALREERSALDPHPQERDFVMNEHITFLRHRESDTGDVRAIASARLAIKVYSRARASKQVEHLLAKPQLDEPSRQDAYLSKLGDELESSGGGLVAMRRQTEDGASFEILSAGAPAYTPPERLLLLQAGRKPRFVDLERHTKVDAAWHSRLMVPVDQQAERAIAALVENLLWLSPDMEALVLDSLAWPSYESRIARIEERLGQQLPASGGESAGGWWRKPLVWLFGKGGQRRPGYLTTLAAGVALAILGFTVGVAASEQLKAAADAFIAGFFSPGVQTGKVNSTGTPPEENAALPAEPADEPDPEAAARKLEEFLETLPSDAQAAMVARSHLAKPFDELYAIGLVKLIALAKGRPLNPNNELGSKDKSAAKILLEELQFTPQETSLIAYVTCHANDLEVAGFPEWEGTRIIKPKAVELQTPCSEAKANLKGAVEGFRALQEQLESRQESPPP